MRSHQLARPGQISRDGYCAILLGLFTDYIDPITEDVAVSVGSSLLIIPAGHFEMGKNFSKVEFKGYVGDVLVRAKIEEISEGGLFKFEIDATGIDLTKTSIPVSIRLVIGADQGATTALVDGKLTRADTDD